MHSKEVDAIAHKPAVVLLALTLLAVISFVAVTRLVASFNHRQHRLAAQLFQLGRAERQAGKIDAAIADFRAALRYDRNNYQYELNLALALVDAKRYDQARAYLLSLWDRAPQDGYVNVALARLYAMQGNFDDAVRYYHHAIYGLWGNETGNQRRQARLELVDLLLSHNERPQAQAELIASASSLPSEPRVHQQIADGFMRAQDYHDALREYREVLTLDRNNAAALAGAGEAAFQLGQYRAARYYLQLATQHGYPDPRIAQLLKTADLILESDPTQRGLPDADRRRRLADAFSQAEQRLQQCANARGEDLSPPPSLSAPTSRLQHLQANWLAMRSHVLRGSFRGDMTAADDALDVVFRIEQETLAECGQPEGKDLALLFISRNREVER